MNDIEGRPHVDSLAVGLEHAEIGKPAHVRA